MRPLESDYSYNKTYKMTLQKWISITALLLLQFSSRSQQSTVGEVHTTHYDKSMDEFIEGVYGYNPNMTLAENKKYYNENGYNFSYKVKDSTIVFIGTSIVILGIGSLIYAGKRNAYNEQFKSQE